MVPLDVRSSKGDVVLPKGGGSDGADAVLLPDATTVVLNLYALHRRHDIYGADADDFRPERWETLEPGWAYVPFGGGPRVCLGRELALAEARYVIVRMAQEFESLAPAEDVCWVEKATMTLCVKSGCKAVLARAKRNSV